MKILLPINLDRVRSPIPTLLREVATRLGEHQFHSFSSPQTDEDHECAAQLWSLANISKTTPAKTVLRRFDVVWHASVTPANFATASAAKLRSLGRCRHLLTANVEMGSSLRYARLFPIALRSADTVVAVSEAVARAVRRDYHVSTDFIVPNGFDPEYYTISGSPKLPEGVREPYFLFCGALTERKRPDLMIEVARLLPDCRFVVVGGNPFPEQGATYLSAIGELPNVQYLGHQSRANVRDLMRSASALLFPSEREGLPLSVIEAMGCGCPVIAQPKSSLPEVIIEGKNGWLLDDDAKQWASRCIMIAEGGKGAAPSPKDVRDSVVNRFAWEQVAQGYSDILRSI